MNKNYLKFITEDSNEFVYQGDASCNSDMIKFIDETIQWTNGHFVTNRRTLYLQLILFSSCLYVHIQNKYTLFGYDIEVI